MLRRILFRLFWNTYDNLGAWLLLSTVAFALSLPLVTAPAAWGALLAMAARADSEKELTLRGFWAAFRHFGKRSTLLGVILAAVLALCVINSYFYASSPAVKSLPAMVRGIMVVLFFWIGLVGLLGIQIGWAFLTLQDLPIRKALKRGFLVLGAHPLAVLISFVLGGIVVGVLIVSVLGVVVLLGGLHANLVMGIAAGAVEHYDVLDDKRERARLESEGAKSWLELRALDEREAARYRRYNRGWKDIFRPWEMR